MAIHTVVALFYEYRDAESAIRDLEAAGIPSSDINLIANNAGNRYGDYPQYTGCPATSDTTPGTATGAGVGAVLGGTAGLLAGIGALAIPGVGPVVAAGALAAMLAGAGVGAAVGGFVGALVDAGIPREHADIYAEAVRRGGTLVVVRIEEMWRERAADTLSRHLPVDIEERAESWRQAGWRGFDERADPYAATDAAAGAGPLPRTGVAPSSAPISGPTDAKPGWQAGAPASADETRRDWEVRRDASRVREDARRRRTGVRTYSRTEEAVGDKR
jgi:hypothetical protein